MCSLLLPLLFAGISSLARWRFLDKVSVLSYKNCMLAKRSAKPAMPRGRYVTDRAGKRTGVVLSLKRYARLMEDLRDLAVVAERRMEKPLSADEMRRRLRQRGHL